MEHLSIPLIDKSLTFFMHLCYYFCNYTQDFVSASVYLFCSSNIYELISFILSFCRILIFPLLIYLPLFKICHEKRASRLNDTTGFTIELYFLSQSAVWLRVVLAEAHFTFQFKIDFIDLVSNLNLLTKALPIQFYGAPSTAKLK